MKILAAGRTSTERAALSLARELGLESGGRCSKGKDYHVAVTRNSTEAEATIAVTRSRYPTLRTTQSIFQAPTYALGFAIIYNERAVADIRRWFRRSGVQSVHVTGHVPFSQSKEFLRSILTNQAAV